MILIPFDYDFCSLMRWKGNKILRGGETTQ